MKIKSLLLLTISSLIVTACTSPSPSSYLPDRGLTTMQAYEQHMSGEIGANPNSVAASSPASNNTNAVSNSPWNTTTKIEILPAFDASLSNSISNELTTFKQDFSKVHNPEIVAYTYPKIDDNGNPVAGYFSAFQLYDRDHYAKTGAEGIIQTQY